MTTSALPHCLFSTDSDILSISATTFGPCSAASDPATPKPDIAETRTGPILDFAPRDRLSVRFARRAPAAVWTSPGEALREDASPRLQVNSAAVPIRRLAFALYGLGVAANHATVGPDHASVRAGSHARPVIPIHLTYPPIESPPDLFTSRVCDRASRA